MKLNENIAKIKSLMAINEENIISGTPARKAHDLQSLDYIKIYRL